MQGLISTLGRKSKTLIVKKSTGVDKKTEDEQGGSTSSSIYEKNISNASNCKLNEIHWSINESKSMYSPPPPHPYPQNHLQSQQTPPQSSDDRRSKSPFNLSSLKYRSFHAKLIGVMNVECSRGDELCQRALKDLKSNLKLNKQHKQLINIHLSLQNVVITTSSSSISNQNKTNHFHIKNSSQSQSLTKLEDNVLFGHHPRGGCESLYSSLYGSTTSAVVVKDEFSERGVDDILFHHNIDEISFIAQDVSDNRTFGYIVCDNSVATDNDDYSTVAGSNILLSNGRRSSTTHKFFAFKTRKSAAIVVLCMREIFQTVFELRRRQEMMALHENKQQYQNSVMNITNNINRFNLMNNSQISINAHQLQQYPTHGPHQPSISSMSSNNANVHPFHPQPSYHHYINTPPPPPQPQIIAKNQNSNFFTTRNSQQMNPSHGQQYIRSADTAEFKIYDNPVIYPPPPPPFTQPPYFAPSFAHQVRGAAAAHTSTMEARRHVPQTLPKPVLTTFITNNNHHNAISNNPNNTKSKIEIDENDIMDEKQADSDGEMDCETNKGGGSSISLSEKEHCCDRISELATGSVGQHIDDDCCTTPQNNNVYDVITRKEGRCDENDQVYNSLPVIHEDCESVGDVEKRGEKGDQGNEVLKSEDKISEDLDEDAEYVPQRSPKDMQSPVKCLRSGEAETINHSRDSLEEIYKQRNLDRDIIPTSKHTNENNMIIENDTFSSIQKIMLNTSVSEVYHLIRMNLEEEGRKVGRDIDEKNEESLRGMSIVDFMTKCSSESKMKSVSICEKGGEEKEECFNCFSDNFSELKLNSMSASDKLKFDKNAFTAVSAPHIHQSCQDDSKFENERDLENISFEPDREEFRNDGVNVEKEIVKNKPSNLFSTTDCESIQGNVIQQNLLTSVGPISRIKPTEDIFGDREKFILEIESKNEKNDESEPLNDRYAVIRAFQRQILNDGDVDNLYKGVENVREGNDWSISQHPDSPQTTTTVINSHGVMSMNEECDADSGCESTTVHNQTSWMNVRRGEEEVEEERIHSNSWTTFDDHEKQRESPSDQQREKWKFHLNARTPFVTTSPIQCDSQTASALISTENCDFEERSTMFMSIMEDPFDDHLFKSTAIQIFQNME